jgi:hypothetical protein
MAASATTADDSSRIAAATTWSNCSGVHTVGVAGQLMAMNGGVSVGSISSTTRRSEPVQGADR